ncbi:hypothetical protein TH61_02505 [Rufibacter sp. DG15C]|uniref:hypothetical protein n=1 Tax=Rufibacter sp. DG15C TaxID=1379909 RepID=UPI00078C7397|nr:hypothetical protein [Rufibacter sp. DG15C]AMM50277.1 hypothetical protein TH61_02505 [Rufibacter sp. DG15C]
MSLSIHLKQLSCLLVICLGTGIGAFAQQKSKDPEKPKAPEQTLRAEIVSDSFEEEHFVHPLPDSSVLVITFDKHSWFSKSKTKYTKYSKALKVLWTKEEENQQGTDFHKITSDGASTFLLYTTRERKKLLLYKLNNRTGEITYTTHVLPNSYIYVNEIMASQGKVFLSGVENYKINILLIDPAVEDCRILPAVFGQEEDLGEFRVDTLTHAAEFLVSETNNYRSRVQVKRMDPKGDVLGTYFLPPRIDFSTETNIQDGRLTPGDTLSKLILGTYGYRETTFARGVFSSDLAGNIKFYDFSKFDRFFDHLSQRQQRRMKAKFVRRERQGKPLVLRYRLLLHPIMPHPQGYALVGEVYYPQYRQNSYYNNYDPRYNVDNTQRRNYDGFRFTHAIVCVFDKEGNLLWDNNYKLEGKTYADLAPTIEAGVARDGQVAILYPDEDELKFKRLLQGVSFTNNEEFEVRVEETDEKRVDSNSEGVVHWYGGNFIAFGFQRIRPKEGKARTVFVLQNLAF